MLVVLRRARRRRAARHPGLPAPSAPPAVLGAALLRASGRYAGTATAARGQDRLCEHGLGGRATADADLHAVGLVLHRSGASTLFIPASSWVRARLAPGPAGRGAGEGSLLVLRWRLGETEVDTAFRADDTSTYPAWVDTINERVPA